jgi:tetratricopeptide (TPR) repeat protein
MESVDQMPEGGAEKKGEVEKETEEDGEHDPNEDKNTTLGDVLSHEVQAASPPEERSHVFETRVERATELWETGKLKFRQNEIASAMKDFETGLYHLDFDELSYNFELLDQHRAAVEKVRIPLWLNVAACLIREKRPKEAIEYCDKVLKEERSHVKALFRRGRAREEIGDYELALTDFQKAHEFAKDDMEITRAITSVRKRVQESQKVVDDLWRGKMKLSSPQPTNKGLAIAEIPSQNILVRFVQLILSMIAAFFALVRGAKNKAS